MYHAHFAAIIGVKPFTVEVFYVGGSVELDAAFAAHRDDRGGVETFHGEQAPRQKSEVRAGPANPRPGTAIACGPAA